MKHRITLEKLSGITFKESITPSQNNNLAIMFNAEIFRLGYCMNAELLSKISALPEKKIQKLYKSVISELKNMKGDNVTHRPMYPNFPQQVMNASDMELLSNAFFHYISNGTWLPKYEKIARKFHLEHTEIKTLKFVTFEEFINVFSLILSSNESISSSDLEILIWFLNKKEKYKLKFPDTIPYKENACIVSHFCLKNKLPIADFVKSATDILRIATYISKGDISLAENTKFVSLPRSQRRHLLYALERVISEEDIKRHSNKWVRLFHNLHIGEYKKQFPKSVEIANKLRNNKKLYSVNGVIEDYFKRNDFIGSISLLKTRPGQFARRLDQLMRKSSKKEQKLIVNEFTAIMDKVSTRVLLQVRGHFNSRGKVNRIIFPKGKTQKAISLSEHNKKISNKAKDLLMLSIDSFLIERFSKLDELGNVFIENSLKNCPIPSQQRSVSKSVNSVARGTRLPIEKNENKQTLRMFIYWVGEDIDLSATFHDENFKMIERVAYTNIRSSYYEACHSGDITYAPNGASEFIDINMSNLLKHGIRYIVMNVLVYSGPSFCDHSECFAGWMLRDKPKSNEIYDPKTVVSKIDLINNGKNAIPVIFDVKRNEAIWCDLITNKNVLWNSESGFCHNWNPNGNNVENNKAVIEEVLKLMTDLKKRTTLYDLFKLHATARGTIINNLEELPEGESINTYFGLSKGVTPNNINTINSEFIV